jgi:hypothetical protein
LPVCLVQALAVAWGACRVQVDLGFAPLIVLPVLAGLVLGVTGVGLLRLLQMGSRPVAVIGVLLSVSTATVAQHYLLYRDHCRAVEEKIYQLQQSGAAPALRAIMGGQLSRPGFVEYLDRQAEAGRPLVGGYTATGAGAWLSWAADAVLMLAATLIVVLPAVKQPYCPKCRTWFRAVRSDRLDEATGRRIAQVAGLDVPPSSAMVRCRLFNCMGGCGPTGVELDWQGARARGVWVDKPTRERVTDLLEEKPTGNKDA